MRNFTDKIPYTEFSIANGNYDTTRKPIEQIIIHSIVGTVQSAINVFGNPAKKTSIHYIIGNDGRLWAGLEEKWTAYHSGNYDVNQKSVGIELEWYEGLLLSNELYATAAKLVADICREYKLGCNRGVIKGHKEITATRCPNAIDVDRIVREAQKLLSPSAPLEDITKLKARIIDQQVTIDRLTKDNGALSSEKDKFKVELAVKDQQCLKKCENYRRNLLANINIAVTKTPL